MRSTTFIIFIGFLLILLTECSEASSTRRFLRKDEPKQETHAKIWPVTLQIKEVKKAVPKTRNPNSEGTEKEDDFGIFGLGGKQPVCKTVLICQEVKIIRVGIKKICKSCLLCV